MKTYRPSRPDEPYLLPPSPREWLPKGHLVFFIRGLLAGLDLGEIESTVQATDARGERPFSPTLMTALLLYAYATGVFSSRGIERACVEDVAFRVLASNRTSPVNRFRAKHLKALGGLFVQVLEACKQRGL